MGKYKLTLDKSKPQGWSDERKEYVVHSLKKFNDMFQSMKDEGSSIKMVKDNGETKYAEYD